MTNNGDRKWVHGSGDGEADSPHAGQTQAAEAMAVAQHPDEMGCRAMHRRRVLATYQGVSQGEGGSGVHRVPSSEEGSEVPAQEERAFDVVLEWPSSWLVRNRESGREFWLPKRGVTQIQKGLGAYAKFRIATDVIKKLRERGDW